MSMLPYLDSNGEIIDGAYFHVLPFCSKNCSSKRCKAHYEKMKSSEPGSYCCPYGLSSYVYAFADEKIIFTGLRIKGTYSKTRAKITACPNYIYNPVISEDSCIAIIKEASTMMLEKKSLETKLDAIRELLHETRKLNGGVKDTIDILWENNADEQNIDYNDLIETLKNVQISSIMISNRFSYFDSVINPGLSLGSPYTAVVFKKFDKMRKLLRNYLRKNVWISINAPTPSTYRYRIYNTFETLLFILLENAIKYSPYNTPVDVIFDEKGNKLTVKIESVGPYNDENELLHICEKGFRGENARLIQSDGQGFGLSFAKKICEVHNIALSFHCSYSHKDHGIKYGRFCAQLDFDNSER